MSKRFALALVALGFATAPALAAEIKCEGVFGKDSTLADFEKAFGKQNVVTGPVNGPEGTSMIATTVFPNDENKRFEVRWWDEEKIANLAGFSIAKADTGPGGLKLGMGIDEVEKLNGEPFGLMGFYWDYGGGAGFDSGKLADQPGGCFVNVQFSPTEEPATEAISNAVSGEQFLQSNMPEVLSLKPVVGEINFGYPDPNYTEDMGDGET